VSETYLDQIAQTVDMLARHHILVLLDFHQDGWGESVGSDGFPAWMTLTGGAQNTHTDFPLYYVTNPAIQAAFQSFWDNAPGPGGVGIRDQFDAMAAALAKRFGAASDVLGYDLINEPWPGTTWEPCGADAGGCPDLDRNKLDAFSASATKAIRASDQRHLVFGEPFVLFNFGNAPTNVLLPGGDANAGLSFHVYPLTPDGVPRVLKNAEAWAQSTGGALLETEWGATGDAAVITQQADEFDSALVPWIFWTYDEDLVRDLHKPPAGDNLVASAVGAVVRPHPLAIAGTPTRVHYDPVTRTLEVSWSTTSPDGRRLPAGTVTSIELPASVYTSGYTVTATGAKATSIANATFLTVTNDTGATTVSVTITPAG
jgi:endoglycosylceramidase